MTGVNSLNNNGAGNVLNQIPVNAPGNGNNAGGINNNVRNNELEALRLGFDVFMENGKIKASERSVSSLTLSRKFAAIESQVDSAVADRANMTLADLTRLLLDHSENVKSQDGKYKALFRDAKESVALDNFMLDMVKKLVGATCFGGHAPNQVPPLKTEIDNVLAKIMKGNYRNIDRKAVLSELASAVDRVKAMVVSGNGERKNEALALLNDIQNRFAAIVENRSIALQNLSKALKSNIKVSFNSPENILGMGCLLKKCQVDLEKVATMPRIRVSDLTEKVTSGEMSVREAISNSPGCRTLMNEFSEANLEKYQKELGDLDEASGGLEAKKIALRNRIPHNWTENAEARRDIRDFTADVLERVKLLNLVKEDAEGFLTGTDAEKLYAGAGHSHEERISAEVARLKYIYDALGGAQGTSLEKLGADTELFAHVLKTFDYAPALLFKFLGNAGAVDALLALRQDNPSDDTVRQSINTLAQFIHSPNSDFDSMMLASLLGGISQEELPASAQVIMQNLPVRIELTKDVLSCLNYVVSGHDENRSPLNISMKDLQKAYRRVCNPGPGLVKLLRDNHCEQDLRTVENIIIKAAYHQFLADHPTAQDETDGFRLPFKDNVRFQQAMNISDTDMGGKINVARYNGFDPTAVNIRNTEMATFLKCFNVMMSHSDFIDSCAKIPAVHLTERFTESLGPRMKEFFKGIISFYNTKKQEANGDEAKLRELRAAINPASFNEFYAAFKRCNTSRELMTFFENNTQKFTELFIASNKLTLDSIKQHNETALRDSQRLMENLHLDDLVKFSRAASSQVGAEIKSVAGTEELLQEVAKMQGSAGLGFLAASVENLFARTVIDILPKGHTYFGLSADDFRKPARLNDIASALRSVPQDLRETADFKFAFLSYAKLSRLAARNPGKAEFSEQELIDARVGKRQVRELINSIRADAPVGGNRNGVNDPVLRTYAVLDNNYVSEDTLLKFCINDAHFSDNDRREALKKLTLTDDMFVPENNIFVGNKAEGEAIRSKIQQAIDNARKALKDDNASVHTVLRKLYTQISNCLARDNTHNVTSALVYLTPYFEKEFQGAKIESHQNFITRKFNDMFSSGKTVQRLRDSLVSTSAEVSRGITGMMSTFRAGSRSGDAAVSELMKNELVSMMAEKALRRVAYSNNFSTYADFKFEFSQNPNIAGKGRDAVIKEAVGYLKADLAVDDVVLEKMIRQLTSSDLYSNDTTSKSKYARRAVRSFGRAFMSTKVVSSVSAGYKAMKSWFTRTPRDAKVYEAISGKVLTSLAEGQTLVHTKDNKVSVEAGKNFNVGNLQVGASAGISLGAGSNLEVERTSAREYTFRMSASLGASLGIGATLGSVADPTLAAKVEFGGNYQRGYSVTFGEEEAVEFLAKIMASNLNQGDFRNSKDIRKQTVKNFDFSAAAEGNAKGSAQVITGNDDSSGYDPLQFSASAEFGVSREWAHEVGTSSHKFTKNVTVTASVGVEAIFSLKNKLLDGANPEKMGDDSGEDDGTDTRNLGEKSRDEIDPELLKYNDDSKDIGSADKIAHLFTNHKKALNDQFFSEMIVKRFSGRKYLPTDNSSWKAKDDFEKYQHDPGRYIAESIVNFAQTNITDKAVADFDGFLTYLGKKIPGISQALEFKEKISELVTSFEGLINKLDTPNFRYDLGLKLGDDSGELLAVNVGASYICETATSYETNLMQNELRSVEQTTKIEPEEKGSASTKKTNNVRFLSQTMKKLGFSKRQMEKAIAQLNVIQLGDESLESIEIVRAGKKASLAKISRKLHREGGSFAAKLGSRVDSMKDADFTPLKIVFNTVKKIDKTSAGISAGGVIKLSLSAEETLNSTKSYEVEF